MKKTLFLIIVSAFLVGCMNTEAGVKVNKDGSGIATLEMSMSEEMTEMFGESMVEQMTEQAEEEGFKIDTVEKDGMVGVKISERFKSVKEIGLFNEAGEEEGVTFDLDIQNGLLDKKAVFKGVLPEEEMFPAGDEMGMGEGLGEAIEESMKEFKMTFKLELPFDSGNNNATEVDGKVLVWDLTDGDLKELYAEASESNTIILIPVSLVVFILGYAIAFLIGRKKKA